MFNLHRHRQQEQAKLTHTEFIKKEEIHLKQRIMQRKEMSERSAERKREWLLKNEHNLEVLNKGSVILSHPSLHNFREPCEKPNIYIRQYKTQDQRVQESTHDYHNAYLELPPYNSKSPHLFPVFLRGNDASGPKFNFTRYNPPLERIETVPWDTSMLANPKWRYPDKTKWQKNRDFIRVTTAFDKQSTAWKQIVSYSNEPYVDGYEVVGDISRKRDKTIEITPTHSQRNSRIKQSNSIAGSLRSLKSMKFMDSFHKGTQKASLKVYQKFPDEVLPTIPSSFKSR